MMRAIVLLLACAWVARGEDLPPSCRRHIFCSSEILHAVQMAELYDDSKTFVDMRMLNDEAIILEAFNELQTSTGGNPTREQLQNFVNENFGPGDELDFFTPTDHVPEPAFLQDIQDLTLRGFARDIHGIWPSLGRIVKPEVRENPERFSKIPLDHGFIIPGGRFTEIYYWDTYWIVEGLLIGGMHETARGIILNLIQLLNTVGLVPNGSRWYYEQRSQPPLLAAMVDLYIQATNDLDFLRDNIDDLEKELQFWLDEQTHTFEKDGKEYTMLRYYAASQGPRPESYLEDYEHAQTFDTEERRQQFYTDIKSAAESGWDFSSRWFIDEHGGNTGDLTNIHTSQIIPVELNAMFAHALELAARFHGLLGNARAGAQWAYSARQWRNAIEEVLWNDRVGIWYDYDVLNHRHRQYFYPTNLAPLWLDAVEEPQARDHGPRVLSYVRRSPVLSYPGGVPASMDRTGEQWDFPNAWPPLVSIVVNALDKIGTPLARETALQVAQTWVRSNLLGYTEHGHMYEKYDVENAGEYGFGGEYLVQEGFGWSNGVIIEFLAKFGQSMTATDPTDDNSATKSNQIKSNLLLG